MELGVFHYVIGFIILSLFLMILIYLLIYKKKIRQMKKFAEKYGLEYTKKDTENLLDVLNSYFSIKKKGQGKFLQGIFYRKHHAVNGIIKDTDITILRCIERHGYSTTGTPYSRGITESSEVKSLFKCPKDVDLDVQYNPKSHKFKEIFPQIYKFKESKYSRIIKGVLQANPPKHRLLLVFKDGMGLIWLKPFFSNSEKEENMDYLRNISKQIKSALEKNHNTYK